MDDATHKVSVVITCYNLGSFLDEAIESVRAQTYKDFEIVIVDDGSTEAETCCVLMEHEHAGMRIIRSENRGLSAARNLGIRSTVTPLVTTLDADDRFLPTMLEKSVAVLDGDSSLGFVSHWLRTFGDEQWEWKPERCDLAALVHANAVNGAALMRRETFEAVGGFDEDMRDGCEDWDFWISVVEAGIAGTIIPEVLYEYRRRGDSMSRVMMIGDGHAKLYTHLARKHVASFRRYVPDLLASREREIVNFRTHIHDLEREHGAWLLPEVSRHRDDVASLERKTERMNAANAWHPALEALRAANERNAVLEGELQRIQHEHAAALEAALENATEIARQSVLQRDADFNRVRLELEDLKQSHSWRITSPLRMLYDSLRRLGGRRA